MPATWTRWRPFPDPRDGGMLVAPFGPGVYEVRNARTGELILVGVGRNCASRMSSLLPKPHGCGTRNNSAKRVFLLRRLRELEYRCRPCPTIHHAKAIERDCFNKKHYRFAT